MSCGQSSDIAPHFDHLDIVNEMEPLTTPLVSCDADGSASHVTLPKCYVALYFDHLDLFSAMVQFTMSKVSHDANPGANDIT